MLRERLMKLHWPARVALSRIAAIKWLPTSRWRIAVWVVAALLVLDLGRSAYARVGYASPVEPWHHAPYTPLAWPPGADLPETAPLGQRVYAQRCAVCHGQSGEGNGPGAPSMIPRPGDFTQGRFKYKSTAAGEPPSDADLERVVARGLNASAMPYFEDILSDREIAAVVDYIKGMSTSFDQGAPAEVTVPPQPKPEELSLSRGKSLYETLGCAVCHGSDGRGMLRLADAKGYPVISRDLTAPWTFRGGSEPEQIWLRLTTGLAPGPMPSYAEQATSEERWQLVNYILSLSRTPPWEPGGNLDGPGQSDDPELRGRYLTHTSMCGLCHTQLSKTLIYSGDQYFLAGGAGVPTYPQGIFVSRNLTPDPETGLGDWSVEEIARAIRTGRTPERLLNLWGMPWGFLHSFSEPDALAIATYLKTLTPVRNQIPDTLHFGAVETIIAKATHSRSLTPPIGNPVGVSYVDGNFGKTAPGPLRRDLPQRALVWAQLAVLVAGAAGIIIVKHNGSRFPTTRRGRLMAVAGIASLVGIGFLGWVMYSTPALRFIPPQVVNSAVTAGSPTLDPASLASREEAQLAERGQYLYKTTSCNFCHGPTGSGGNKISSRDSFGTIYVANITPDPQTGIGLWSDQEIARVIRSGVTPQGRQLHWQGMIWDHLANIDEQDLQALIVYLKTLPPVEKPMPEARPPAADDCADYTFYIRTDPTPPGCD